MKIEGAFGLIATVDSLRPLGCDTQCFGKVLINNFVLIIFEVCNEAQMLVCRMNAQHFVLRVKDNYIVLRHNEQHKNIQLCTEPAPPPNGINK